MKNKRTLRPAAVALEYDPATNDAPRVLASGFGVLAERILEIARQEGIHIHRNDNLAELLARVPAGSEIPEAAYRLVAELLAFLYRTDRRLAEKMSAVNRQDLPPVPSPSSEQSR